MQDSQPVMMPTWSFPRFFLAFIVITNVFAFHLTPRHGQSSYRRQATNSDASRLMATTASTIPSRKRKQQQRDVIIVGGGLAGLSAALYLTQIDPDRHVTILESQELDTRSTTVASFAAAGMLAPQSERLPAGSLLDMCIESRNMYTDFCDLVESLAQDAGQEGAKYLWKEDDDGGDDEKKSMGTTDPWSVGYMVSGGFLAPAFAGDSVATWAPPQDAGQAVWLDSTQVRELEPHLHPSVVGGWWFPEDASVDARRLTCSLRAACVAAGVQILAGPEYEVSSLDLGEGSCRGVWIHKGTYLAAKTVLVANGAWMRSLLPVPIEPHKGQSLSLRMPSDRPPILRRVLFAQDSYIVPKADGRIVVGATVEAGSFDANVTPAGLLHIITHALELVPGLKDLPIEETWVGLRPTTPDKGPILGKTPWENLFLAGGYWRNGVLLAPKTGQLLATLMSGNELEAADAALLEAFAWDRFTSKTGSALAANSRYAASMHPVHSRASGVGISAAVGTELGSYSTAPSAKEERERDRKALWGAQDDEDSAFERAAAMGREDASAFSNAGQINGSKDTIEDSLQPTVSMLPFEGSPDAYTVNAVNDMESAYQSIQDRKATLSVEMNENEESERPDPGFRISHIEEETGEVREVPPYTSPGDFLASIAEKQEGTKKSDGSVSNKSNTTVPSDLESAYKTIKANKQRVELNDSSDEERPDPGFRIYHVDPETEELTVVPPYTSPGDFLASLEQNKSAQVTSSPSSINDTRSKQTEAASTQYTEQTFDGYQDIQQANSRESREDELEAMREARKRNRVGQEVIDESKFEV